MLVILSQNTALYLGSAARITIQNVTGQEDLSSALEKLYWGSSKLKGGMWEERTRTAEAFDNPGDEEA